MGVGYGGGQTSHQSVSRPYGEQRSIVQSKAFGAAHASVHQVDNSRDFLRSSQHTVPTDQSLILELTMPPLLSIMPLLIMPLSSMLLQFTVLPQLIMPPLSTMPQLSIMPLLIMPLLSTTPQPITLLLSMLLQPITPLLSTLLQLITPPLSTLLLPTTL